MGADSNTSVVVIDDDEDDRFLFRRMLRRVAPDAELVEYRAADEAIGDFDDAQRFSGRFGEGPVLLFLDINMPRMTGFEFLEQLGNGRRDSLRVVLLSASESPRDRERAATFEIVSDTLAKPISKAKLRELLSRA